jgi:hypothetical protein
MADVMDYPTTASDLPDQRPDIRRVKFGDAGLITYLINDGVMATLRGPAWIARLRALDDALYQLRRLRAA